MSDPEYVIPFDELPENFARSIEDPPVQPARPRPAATIVLLRDAHEGMEVLLMRRSRKAGFVPGAYVFPGGRVDGSDADVHSVASVDGLSALEAEQRLDLVGADPPAIAYYLAALREAFEETGILVAHMPDGTYPPTAAEDPAIDEIREAVMDDRLGFAEALSRIGCRIAGDAIEYLAHWITPTPEPRRFDARFFAARVREGSTPLVDPREMTDAVWTRPDRALNRLDQGTLPMVFPTIKTLEDLSPFTTVDEALQAIGRVEVRTILPTLVITPTGVGTRLDGGDAPTTD